MFVVLPVTTVCRTRWVYHTWRWMKSEQRSVQASEAAEAASLPGFTQTGTVTAPDNLLLRSTCVLVQHFGLIYQTSVAFATQTAKYKGEPEKKNLFFPSPEIPTVFLHICKYFLQSIRCTRKALFQFLLLLSFVCVHARTSLHRSERLGGHLIPQFPWINF